MKNRRVKIIALSFLGIFIVTVVCMWAYDVWRHRGLVNDFNATVQSIKSDKGGEFQDHSGCKYEASKGTIVGGGDKVCTLEVRATYDTVDLDEAKALFGSIRHNLVGFDLISESEMQNMQNPKYVDGVVVVRHQATKETCASIVTYDDSSREALHALTEVRFKCDDTSWFARTFQRNNSIFSY